MSAISLSLFGGYYRGKRDNFSFLSTDLLRARMNVTVEKWLSAATTYALLLAPMGVALLLAVAAFGFGYIPIWRHIFGSNAVGINVLGILGDFGVVAGVTMAVFLASFLLFILFPRVKYWERKAKIDGQLPYAIGWMSSMATTGVVPYMIFKKLAEAEEFFGEVSREAALVVKDVELLGFDFIGALRNLASVTPSTHLRTFIQGALTNTLSGGDMRHYFITRAAQTMEENRKHFADFIKMLEMIAEVYIIALVAAPLLVIIMFAAMMMLRGSSPTILMLIIYGVIPLGSMLFILLIDSLTPQGVK